jgi:putative addiction module killer protein
MELQPHKLKIYTTDDDEAPFLFWLNSLKDRRARARIKKRLDRVAFGNFGDHRSVGEGVFEFRIDHGPGYRLYFAQIEMFVILLLYGGDKSTQARDILKAKQFWAKFKLREYVNE